MSRRNRDEETEVEVEVEVEVIVPEDIRGENYVDWSAPRSTPWLNGVSDREFDGAILGNGGGYSSATGGRKPDVRGKGGEMLENRHPRDKHP